jgi:hypothetical protein
MVVKNYNGNHSHAIKAAETAHNDHEPEGTVKVRDVKPCFGAQGI